MKVQLIPNKQCLLLNPLIYISDNTDGERKDQCTSKQKFFHMKSNLHA